MSGAGLVHLVLIETTGNQRFVFDTNKRRENVGGSQLIHDLGAAWVPEALGPSGTDRGDIESGRPEIVVASAGKALVLMPDRPSAKALVAAVTTRALKQAPGLDVCGVVSAQFEWGEAGGLAAASKEVHRRFQDVRGRRPAPDLRFLRLPLVSECSTSGLPASGLGREVKGAPPIDLARPSLARWRDAYEAGLRRMACHSDTGVDVMRQVISYLADDSEWAAVVHADGNGVGRIFQDFAGVLPEGRAGSDRTFADTLRNVSNALDRCAIDAFKFARKVDVPPAAIRAKVTVPPILPLVVGGDDLTVVCDGMVALEFATRFATMFEDLTADDPVVAAVLKKVPGTPARIAACAGVAIVKRHYPFSAAYDLCDELTASAKTVRRLVMSPDGEMPCSAIDFHVLHDSSASELSSLRAPLVIETGDERDKYVPVGGPFVVSPLGALAGAEQPSRQWAARHHWSELCRRAAAVVASDDHDGDERRLLPRTQTHVLRSALFDGPEVAKARFNQLLVHYRDRGLATIGGEDAGEPSLYWLDAVDGRTRTHRTSILDALDAAAFLSPTAIETGQR